MSRWTPILNGDGYVVNEADEFIVFSRALEDAKRYLLDGANPDELETIFMQNIHRRCPRLFCKLCETCT
jgi:hypothetical protein